MRLIHTAPLLARRRLLLSLREPLEVVFTPEAPPTDWLYDPVSATFWCPAAAGKARGL